MAIPLKWKILENKRGNSSQTQRIELMEKFLKCFSLDFAVKLVADREFVGKDWLAWLDQNGIHYVIRIRKNQLMSVSERKQVHVWTRF